MQTGQHPSVTTEQNIATMKAQLRALGLAHDPRRGPATTDVSYYRWTQWIFLQIYNSWYDDDADRARPIAELVEEFRGGARPTPDGIPFDDMGPLDQRQLIDPYRLAYVAEATVNWCPGLGTVLANEEVTADGRSDRGNFPVYRRPLKQWMLRITAYADRLDRRSRRARLARVGEADAAQLDRPQHRREHPLPGRGPRGRVRRGVHDPPRHDLRRDVHGARARASARRRDRLLRVAGRRGVRRLGEQPDRRMEGRVRDHRHAGRRGASLPRVHRGEERPRATGRQPRQDGRVHRWLRRSIP